MADTTPIPPLPDAAKINPLKALARILVVGSTQVDLAKPLNLMEEGVLRALKDINLSDKRAKATIRTMIDPIATDSAVANAMNPNWQSASKLPPEIRDLVSTNLENARKETLKGMVPKYVTPKDRSGVLAAIDKASLEELRPIATQIKAMYDKDAAAAKAESQAVAAGDAAKAAETAKLNRFKNTMNLGAAARESSGSANVRQQMLDFFGAPAPKSASGVITAGGQSGNAMRAITDVLAQKLKEINGVRAEVGEAPLRAKPGFPLAAQRPMPAAPMLRGNGVANIPESGPIPMEPPKGGYIDDGSPPKTLKDGEAAATPPASEKPAGKLSKLKAAGKAIIGGPGTWVSSAIVFALINHLVEKYGDKILGDTRTAVNTKRYNEANEVSEAAAQDIAAQRLFAAKNGGTDMTSQALLGGELQTAAAARQAAIQQGAELPDLRWE